MTQLMKFYCANKKLVWLCLAGVLAVAATVIAAVALIPKSAPPQPEEPVVPIELLENPGFETGDSAGYYKYGYTGSVEIAEGYAHSGAYGLLLHSRTHYQATYAQRIEPVLTENGPGTYKASVWVKLKEGTKASANCQLVIEFQQDNGKEARYFASEKQLLTDQWQEFVFEGEVDFDPAVPFRYAYIYQRSYDNMFNAPDVCIDDFSLVKCSEKNGTKYENIQTVDKNRTETTTVGAIRWDAWYAHDGQPGSTVSQVEKTLSPAQFHFRAPFYAKVTDEGNITIPAYDQKIFDQEIRYAKEAGIDYFAYVWYNDDKAQSRKFHVASELRNAVKMCACFHELSIADDATRAEMATLLTQDYYMTVQDGRPLMFFFVTNTQLLNVAQDIAYYRQLAVDLNIPDPYIVAMTVKATALDNIKLDADAVSNYSVAGGNLMPFSGLTEKAFNTWEDYRHLGAEYVPIVSAGWQTEPRYLNPVSWQTVKENSWAQYAQPQEITDHLTYAIAYLNHPEVMKQTDANTCILYAWNEFDEGGWICPTIAVDEQGNQIYAQDGTPQVNTERIHAVKKAIENYKNGKLPEVTLSENGASAEEDDRITS